MFKFVDSTNFLNIHPSLTDSDSSTVSVHNQTVTLPLDLYHRILNQHCKNDEMDEFFMYSYKVKLCSRKRAHDWTECPYAHRGEKAKRRDPRKFPYQGIICPVFRSEGECTRGENCEFSHGIFEFWLHPSRFRTRLCEAGLLCPRRVCFFAHGAEQLRHTISYNSLSHATSSSNVTGQLLLNAPASAAAAATSSSKRCDNSDLKVMYEDFPHFDWVMDVCSFDD